MPITVETEVIEEMIENSDDVILIMALKELLRARKELAKIKKG